jgi:hypothetical protein
VTETWVGGVHMTVSDWYSEMASFDFEGVQVDVPIALAHLLVNLDVRNYDSSGLGPGNDVIAKTRSLLTREFMEDLNITK